MKTLYRAVLVLAAASAAAASLATEKAPAPAAARFYPLVGKWTGSGAFQVPGQPATKLSLDYRCRKVSGGAAVTCELRANGKGMDVRETDLFGVNPLTGQGHWYAVTNMGETHDHQADWTDPKTMKAAASWTQEGKQMREDITMQFTGAKSFEFRSVVTQDGKEVGSFNGKLKR